MDNSTIVLLINDDARAIMGRYEPGGKAELFKTLDQSIEVDDIVVVQSGTRLYYTTVRVTEIDVDVNFDTAKDVKWVVDRVDIPAHHFLLEQEKEAIGAVQSAERRRKRDELRATMFTDHQEQIKSLSIANIPDAETVTE